MVHIECTGVPKPFLGGYKNRRTGLEYHNAAVQTLPKKRPDKGVSIFSCNYKWLGLGVLVFLFVIFAIAWNCGTIYLLFLFTFAQSVCTDQTC